MAAVVTVIYPNTEGAKFDMDYYLSKHMPLVSEKWGPHGLTHWRITHFTSTASGDKPPYLVEAKLEFESEEAFKKAASAEGKEVFGDVPKFTDIQPSVLFGEIKGEKRL